MKRGSVYIRRRICILAGGKSRGESTEEKNIQVLEAVHQLEDRSDGKNGKLYKRKAAN